MIQVDVVKQANYPVSTPKIKKKLKDFFAKKGIVSSAQVEVAIVGTDEMRKIDGKVHSVLSFTPEETKKKFIYPLDGIIHLGEIIICFPEVLKEAKQEGKLIQEKTEELVEHGALHLLGIHHP